MTDRQYTINTHGRLSATAVFVSDLHESDPTEVIAHIINASPDLIIVGGDLIEAKNPGRTKRSTESENAYRFLREASAIAPVYYGLGNHETFVSDEKKENARKLGAILLENDCVTVKTRGGVLTVGAVGIKTDADFIDRFDRIKTYKILICHEPDRAVRELSGVSADLILSGHAHGGQWRIFGHGIYAPGQGFFPKLTRGEYVGMTKGRFIVSAGAANSVAVPRFCNPTETVILHFK